MRAAQIDHRLDGEEHAGLQLDAFAHAAIVQHVGMVVEGAAEAMAAEITDHRAAFGLGKALDGVADVTQMCPRLHHGNAAHEAFIGDLDQALRLAVHFAHHVHARGITMPAIDDQGDVDVDDVAVAQRLVIGNAVADDVVDRGADRLGVAPVVVGGGNGIVRLGEVDDHLVELVRGDAGLDQRHEQVEGLGGQPPGLAHGLEIRRAMELDAGRAGRGFVFGKGHR